MSEPWVDRIKALDGVRVVKAATNCDLTITALEEAFRYLGIAQVYTVYFHPAQINMARRLYGYHGHGIHKGAMQAPIINFVPDGSLKNENAWSVEANCIRFESDGV